MANIKQQKKRVGIQERQRTENLRYRSTIKTLTKRLEAAVADADAERVSAEHHELVRIPYRQSVNQHAVQQAEDGRVRPYAKGE